MPFLFPAPPALIRATVALVAGVLATAAPALAQNAESATDRRVQDLITAQKSQTDLRDKRCYLPRQPGADIVVCGRTDHEAERLPLRDELESVQSLNDGLPRAPDVAGGGIFKGPPTLGGLCLFGPCPKDAVYYVDVAALPPAPKGSDADLIARGEKAQP
ncbi:MAG: hypothetical protein ABW194_06895 [Novosphingobium sp.]